jgi:anti-anti-sigma factor
MDIIIRRHREGAAVLTLRGNLHCGTPECDLKNALADLAQRGSFRCVLNLKDVAHLDTTCLGVLIGAEMEFQRHDGGVRLVQTPERIKYVLSISKLDRALLTFSSEEEAVRDFGRPRSYQGSLSPAS